MRSKVILGLLVLGCLLASPPSFVAPSMALAGQPGHPTWCEAIPGDVIRVGRNFQGNVVTPAFWDNWRFFAGGSSSADLCINNMLMPNVTWCGIGECANPGATAEQVCASNPTVYTVTNRIDAVYYGGVNQGAQVSISYCCEMFGRNCPGK